MNQETEQPQAINSDTYLEMLKTIFPANKYTDDWFQQDEVTPYPG